MAQNLFEQLLAVARTILSGSTVQSDYSEYVETAGIQEYPAGLPLAHAEPLASRKTGVERYLEGLAVAAAEAEAAAMTKTGVQRYLESHGLVVKERTAAPTGVERYLARQLEAEKAAILETEVTTSDSKVLDAEPEAIAVAKSASTERPPIVTKPAAAARKRTSGGVLDFSGDLRQCQASTAKGEQCRRTTGLARIQRTLNDREYQFAVCVQHNDDSFKPYRGLIETA